jgi:hypothetical protein
MARIHRSASMRLAAGLVAACAAAPVVAADDDLAKQLSNPVAALISVPFQFNYDHDFGDPERGHRALLNIQPVIPISLNAQWNLISRTILPIIDQSDVVPDTHQSGIGDIVQSFFLSPVEPTAGGLIWGAGPVFLLPTGSNGKLSARKWGLGPTGVVLKQQGPWTFGGLANHIWSVAGDDDRSDISSTFLQPFVSYTTPTAWTYTLNTESTYDWKARQWSVPINGMVSKVMKWGDQPVSVGGGLRYWADGPDGGPHGWGLRLAVTFLFPR